MTSNTLKLVVSLEAGDIIYLEHQKRYVRLMEWIEDEHREVDHCVDGSVKEQGVYDLWNVVELNSWDCIEDVWIHSENQNGNVTEYFSGHVAERFLI